MTIIVSTPHELDGDGPSRPWTHIVNAVQDAYEDVVTVTPSDLDAFTLTDRLGEAAGVAYDELATRHLIEDAVTDADLFVGNGGSSLRQMHLLDTATTVTTWFSTYGPHAARVLEQEYERAGVDQSPMHPYVQWRSEQERHRSDHLIVPSRFAADTYPDTLPGTVHVCEFGVDTSTYQPGPTSFDDDRLHTLVPVTNPLRKGVPYLVDAVQQLATHKHRFHVTGGWGDQRLANHPSFQFHGWVSNEDMQTLYQACDVLLLPSLEEGQALSVLEALASGTPVVITEETGHDIDADAARYITARSADDIADALSTLHDDPDLLADASKQARAYAEKHPWSQFQNRIVNVLDTVKEGTA